MLEEVGGLERLSRLPADRTLSIGARGGLFDLLVILLAEEVARLIREGLNVGYDEREEDLRVVRGRLMVRDQALRHFGRVDRLACRFDELDKQTPENELLRLALATADPACLAGETRALVRRVLSELTDQLDLETQPRSQAVLRHLVPPGEPDLNRHLSRYRNAIELSWLILEHQLIDRPLSRGGTRSFAFLMDMNVLFEQYLTRWLRLRLSHAGCRVGAQISRLALRDVATRRRVGAIRPDILVWTPEKQPLAIDAKYKRYAGVDEDRRPRPPMSDLTQALIYAQVYGGPGRERRTILVFPTETGLPSSRSLELRDPTARGDSCVVNVLPFPLHAALNGHRDRRLDDLVATAAESLLVSDESQAVASSTP
jgi:5-methylcytosine-specific restriction enzyme subunit McrC